MVGDIIARNAQPDKIRQGTLFVKVSSHVWMQQLQYLKDTISEKLNHRLGGEVVKNIFFYVGEIISPVAEPATLPAAPSATQPAQPTTLNEQVLDSINDAEIRSGFQKLFAAHSRRPKS
jgi:hypothetical protein